MITNPRNLDIWQEAYKLTLAMYKALEPFPEFEEKNLKGQLRRATTSILLNITEGVSSQANRMCVIHLGYAYSSAKEVETALILCKDLGYIQQYKYDPIKEALDKLIAKMYRFQETIEHKHVQELKSKRGRIAEEVKRDFKTLFEEHQ